MLYAALRSLGVTPVPALDEPATESLEQLQQEISECEDFIFAQLRERGNVFVGASIGLQGMLAVAPALCTALGAWLHARYGRKVRLKIGEIEVEAQTREEVEKLLAKALEIQRNNEPKKLHEP